MLGMLSELTISMNVVMYNDKPMCAYFAHFLHPAENKPVVLALRVISYDAVPKAKDLKKDLDSIMKFYDISDSILSYVILNCGFQLMTQLQDLPLTTQAEQNRVLMEVLANLLRATTSGENLEDVCNPMAPVSDASNRMRRKGGRDKRHWAWQFFNTGEPSENGGPPSAQCKLCESIIKWAGSTNIGKHLRRRHKDIFQDESIKTEIVTSPLNSTADSISMAPSIASQLNNNKLTDIKVNNCTTSVIKKEVISRSESPVITNNIKPINRIQNNNIQSLINSTTNNNTSITNSVGAANICNLINSKRSGISLSRRYLALYHAAYPLGNVENEFFKKFCSLINAELPDKRTLNLDALNEITAIIDDGKAMLGMLSELTISMNVVMYNDKPMCAYFAHFLHPAENKPVVLALRVISYDAVPKAKDLKKDLDSIMKFYDISDSILSYVILNCGFQLMTQLQDLPLTTQAEQNRVLMEVLANLLRATTNNENLEDVCNSISTMETESNNNYEDKEDGGKKQSSATNLIYKKRFHYNVQLDECYDLFGKERFYKCSAHQLFEIIEMAIEKFDRLKKLREKVLELLALLYQSPVAICTLSKMGITNIPFPTDSSWNSVLIAYNALVEYQTYVQINTVADGQGWKTLSEEDIKLMSEYVEIFTKCNEYLDMIQNGTASYISMIYPTLHAILNHLKKDLWSYLNDVPKVLEKDIRETFKDILESGKGDIKDHIFIVASLLDRRASWLLTDDEKKLAMSTTLTLIQKNKSKCATIDSSEDGSQMDSNDINQQLFGQSSLALSSLIHNSPFKDLVQDRFTNSSIEMSIDTPEKEE
uniref:BED-type domain-containing protein n=1 Tax=Strongyloides papillosus TaxID=174720 RepID=A0A0N5C216_STREA